MSDARAVGSTSELYVLGPGETLVIRRGPEGSIAEAVYHCQEGDRVVSVEDPRFDDSPQGDRVLISDAETGARLYEVGPHGPRLLFRSFPDGRVLSSESAPMQTLSGDIALVESALQTYAAAVRDLPQQSDAVSIWDDIDADDLSV